MAYDLMIRNGNVIDGSGLARYRADVAVKVWGDDFATLVAAHPLRNAGLGGYSFDVPMLAGEHVTEDALLLLETKNGKARRLPLSGAARAVLEALPRVPGRPYVFTKCGLIWDPENPTVQARRTGPARGTPARRRTRRTRRPPCSSTTTAPSSSSARAVCRPTRTAGS